MNGPDVTAQRIVENSELDTVLVGRPLRNTARVARNAVSEEVATIQRDRAELVRQKKEFERDRAADPGARVIEAPNENGGEGRLVLEIDAREELDAAMILDSLKSRGVAGIRGVSLVD